MCLSCILVIFRESQEQKNTVAFLNFDLPFDSQETTQNNSPSTEICGVKWYLALFSPQATWCCATPLNVAEFTAPLLKQFTEETRTFDNFPSLCFFLCASFTHRGAHSLRGKSVRNPHKLREKQDGRSIVRRLCSLHCLGVWWLFFPLFFFRCTCMFWTAQEVKVNFSERSAFAVQEDSGHFHSTATVSSDPWLACYHISKLLSMYKHTSPAGEHALQR